MRGIRCWLNGFLVSILTLFGAAQAEPYPSKPITLIVPFSAGGGTDVIARIFSNRLSQQLNIPIVVQNRPGADAVIGSRVVVSSKPDGYTLLFASSGHAINPSLYKDLQFETTKDLSCVTQAAVQHIVLVVHPSVPVKTVDEFVQYAKAHPGEMNFGSSSKATQLPMELFMALTDISMTNISYKGSAPVMVDLISGRIHASMGAVATVEPFIRDGRVRALGQGDGRRAIGMEEIPTIAESGVPAFQATLFNGIFAPSGVPQAIINTLSGAIQNMYQDPEFVNSVRKAGFDPVGSTPTDCNAFVDKEIIKWASAAKRAGIKPQ